MTNGVMGSKPWGKYDKVKVLCPVPGYDRHFAVSEFLGMELVNVPMKEDGPDMDIVEKLVAEDDTIKAIWCVPMYSNPGGVVYSDAVVKRFAALKPKAKDFRIFWDNAYCVHHLVDNPPVQANLLEEAKKAGNEDICYMFASTSKITHPGSGIAIIAASQNNLAYLKKALGFSTIGYDKMNQLRHLRFFGGKFENLVEHMKKHKALIAPKFQIVESTLEQELADLGIANWSNPQGGYFISFNQKGCAKRIVSLCKEAGVVLTGAGASFPHGVDPEDENIRISPHSPQRKNSRKQWTFSFVLQSWLPQNRLWQSKHFAQHIKPKKFPDGQGQSPVRLFFDNYHKSPLSVLCSILPCSEKPVKNTISGKNIRFSRKQIDISITNMVQWDYM